MSENSKILNYGHRPYLAPAIPNTPLEICVPDTVQLPEPPTFAGKTISFLMAAKKDVNTIEYAEDEGEINSSDEELKQFLLSVEETKMMGKLLAHCKSIMFAVGDGGALGHMTRRLST
ncbi:hypothetical protein [Undibacterium sp. TC9W]|uniref:hypothetical protein n=1 Tax=Undibacterium sp. TC9W TaxID=3413053 RepID=UPI003BF401FA